MAVKKQFDLSHLQVAESVQNEQLASFSKRLIAIFIDSALIAALAKFNALIVPLVLIYFLFKKGSAKTIKSAKERIDKSVNLLEEKLEELESSDKIRKQFITFLKKYLRVLIILVISILVVKVVLIIVFSAIGKPESLFQVNENSTSVLNFTLFFDNFSKLLTVMVSATGSFIYFALFNWKWNGQTPGKRLLGIRIIKLNGKKMSLWNSLERVSGYAASASLAFLGFLQFFWDKNHQTTHDKISETIVVLEKKEGAFKDPNKELET